MGSHPCSCQWWSWVLFMVYIVVVGGGLWVALAMFKFVGMGGHCGCLMFGCVGIVQSSICQYILALTY